MCIVNTYTDNRMNWITFIVLYYSNNYDNYIRYIYGFVFFLR